MIQHVCFTNIKYRRKMYVIIRRGNSLYVEQMVAKHQEGKGQ